MIKWLKRLYERWADKPYGITKNGKLHKTNGPASYWGYGGMQTWFLYGEMHRYYGPGRTIKHPQKPGNDWWGRDEFWFIHGRIVKK